MANILVGSTFTDGKKVEGRNASVAKGDAMLAAAKSYADSFIGSGEGVEYGYNSNGRWVRFNNGTQICWNAQSHGSQSISAVWGKVFTRPRYSSHLNPFPKSFVKVPIVLKGMYSLDGYTFYQASEDNPSTTHPGGFEPVRATTATVSDLITTYIAIGEWK